MRPALLFTNRFMKKGEDKLLRFCDMFLSVPLINLHIIIRSRLIGELAQKSTPEWH